MMPSATDQWLEMKTFLASDTDRRFLFLRFGLFGFPIGLEP